MGLNTFQGAGGIAQWQNTCTLFWRPCFHPQQWKGRKGGRKIHLHMNIYIHTSKATGLVFYNSGLGLLHDTLKSWNYFHVSIGHFSNREGSASWKALVNYWQLMESFVCTKETITVRKDENSAHKYRSSKLWEPLDWLQILS